MSAQPIGLFDSGVGGTSIWKAINALLPYESTIFMADSRHAPYGGMSREAIVARSVNNTDFLLERGCKLVVVACNTATTNAIAHLRKQYSVPFIGIEPAIKPAALKSKSGTVGVLATKGTLASELFARTSALHAAGVQVIEQEGAGLVPLIEAGKIRDPETRRLLEKYLTPMLAQGMDCLVLGCTHYPYLMPVLQEILPPGVQIIDSGMAVAKQTATVLRSLGLLNEGPEMGRHAFVTNADLGLLQLFLEDVVVEHTVCKESF